ncbi:MAG: hypothetical protein C0406_04705 [Sideroxydans sp.]|nr:hypothetical protein [Sideroxydans sp.]
MNSNSGDDPSYINEGKRVAALHKRQLGDIARIELANVKNLSVPIASSEALLLSLGYTLPEGIEPSESHELYPVDTARKWDEILVEAKNSTPEHVDFNMLLTQEEIDAVLSKHRAIGRELDWFESFDRYDFALCIAAGIVAGVVDVLLVGVPQHAGFLGSSASEGGKWSNAVKDKVGKLFPPDKIKELEKAYSVPYDASTNFTLNKTVEGLGPGTHRFQSVGHDPLLGFIFGVRDILTGEFSAIGNNGHVIVQQVSAPFLQGEHLVVRILEAMKVQLGHLASDVATSRGLPAPLMPLLQFLQFGKIGSHEHTIAEVARAMYGKGYDFRHFMAASIPVMISEIIIRLGYFIRSVQSGKNLIESIPSTSSLKLRRQLLLTHSVAMLINAGKVCVTKNPLAISWPQALAFLRYVMPELAFLMYGKEAAKSKMVEDEIINDYHIINDQLSAYLKTQDDFVIVI